ncbi:MAG: LysR family transcriptional regulator [Lachnospiraceae bacterium]|nr:LysR family transcriptional regulator [Lachnospiraceae bacterium]
MKEPLKFHLRLQLYRRERNFGPGVTALMQLVQEKSSLSAACKTMHMSYSKAWKIIRKTEDDLGIKLMEGTRGGESGGGTVLTEDGRKLLEQYHRFEQETECAAQEIFRRIFEST